MGLFMHFQQPRRLLLHPTHLQPHLETTSPSLHPLLLPPKLLLLLLGIVDSNGNSCEIPPPCRGKVLRVGYVNYYESLDYMRQSRFLFVPAVYDASPRVITEAMSLNVPVLMNENIVGGWKYICKETGVFFSGISSLKGSVVELMSNLNTYTPRSYIQQHYGRQISGKQLKGFVEKFFDHRVKLPKKSNLLIPTEPRRPHASKTNGTLTSDGSSEAEITLKSKTFQPPSVEEEIIMRGAREEQTQLGDSSGGVATWEPSDAGLQAAFNAYVAKVAVSSVPGTSCHADGRCTNLTCDDGDDNTVGDKCQAGTCSGTPLTEEQYLVLHPSELEPAGNHHHHGGNDGTDTTEKERLSAAAIVVIVVGILFLATFILLLTFPQLVTFGAAKVAPAGQEN